MPTLEQIRAARALLGWNQHELANKAGLSQTGIARIENGTNQPNSKTLEKIGKAFDDADIEFISDSGLRKRTGEMRTLRGEDGFRQLLNEVYDAAKAGDNNICLFNGLPLMFKKWLSDDWYDMHSKRMQKLEGKFKLKIIVKEGEQNFIASDFAQYRWFPEHLFKDKTFYAYSGHLAFMNFSENDLIIRIMDQAEFSESFRVLFNIAWDNVAMTSSQQD